MKSREAFDLQYKLEELARLANDVATLLRQTDGGYPASHFLAARFLKMADFSRRIASYVRLNEELPPVAQPQIDVLPSNVKQLPKALK